MCPGDPRILLRPYKSAIIKSYWPKSFSMWFQKYMVYNADVSRELSNLFFTQMETLRNLLPPHQRDAYKTNAFEWRLRKQNGKKDK